MIGPGSHVASVHQSVRRPDGQLAEAVAASVADLAQADGGTIRRHGATGLRRLSLGLVHRFLTKFAVGDCDEREADARQQILVFERQWGGDTDRRPDARGGLLEAVGGRSAERGRSARIGASDRPNSTTAAGRRTGAGQRRQTSSFSIATDGSTVSAEGADRLLRDCRVSSLACSRWVTPLRHLD